MPDPLPGAADIEKLAGEERENPGSSALLPLARAYLALGRPGDAIDALARGLHKHPEPSEARLCLAKAHIALDQLREAQTELLEIVKLDRGSREGFQLLGQVLMRRGDYERAVPILEHGLNLDPSDTGTRLMLAQARERQPLDPTGPALALGRVVLEKQPLRPAEERVASRRRPDDRAEVEEPANTAYLPPAEDPFRPLADSVQQKVPAPVARQSEREAHRISRRRWVGLGLACVLAGVMVLAWTLRHEAPGETSVSRRVATAREKLALGRPWDYGAAIRELEAAAQRWPKNQEVASLLLEVRALAMAAYGLGAKDELSATGSATPRVLAMARAALGLAGQDPKALSYARAELADWAESDRDRVGSDEIRWLDGMVKLALGDRTGARATLRTSRSAMAHVVLGDMALDEGDLGAATEAYRAALSLSGHHPLAEIGLALAGEEVALAPSRGSEEGGRVAAWRSLLRAQAAARAGDREGAGTELTAAASSRPSEARLLARIGLERIDLGHIVEAERLMDRIRSSDAVKMDLVTRLFGAELELARGTSAAALLGLGDLTSVRARRARGRALLELDRPAEALAELEAALAADPGDRLSLAMRELARVKTGVDTRAALSTLRALASSGGGDVWLYLLAEAELALDRTSDARAHLRESQQTGGAYSHIAATRLARLDLAAPRAEPLLRQALWQSPGYWPARAALGRLLIKSRRFEAARTELERAYACGGADPGVFLSYAESLARTGLGDQAVTILQLAKAKGAESTEAARVGALVKKSKKGEVFATEQPRTRRRRSHRRRQHRAGASLLSSSAFRRRAPRS